MSLRLLARQQPARLRVSALGARSIASASRTSPARRGVAPLPHGPSALLGRRSVNMAAFSDPDFDFRRYLEERPRAPDSLYDDVLAFHQGERGTVLDVGCGPGISLFPLVPHFKRAVGVDPSEGMIAEAGGAWEAYCASALQGKRPDTLVEFKQGSAEKLASIADASVDLVTAAQAAHWFDYAALWPELSRVLRPGGSVAFWGYGTNFLPDHPALWPQMAEFMSSRAPVLGPYWPLPGRRLLEDLLAEIPFPQDEAAWDVAGAKRKMHTLAAPGVPELASPAEPYRMERVMTFEQLNGYFHTSSALSRFYKAHPERRGEKPDMIDVHVERLREAVLAERASGIGAQEGLDEQHVRVAWPLGLMMIRKRGQA